MAMGISIGCAVNSWRAGAAEGVEAESYTQSADARIKRQRGVVETDKLDLQRHLVPVLDSYTCSSPEIVGFCVNKDNGIVANESDLYQTYING